MTRAQGFRAPANLLAGALLVACGTRKAETSPAPPAPPTATVSAAPEPEAPPSPFSVVLESSRPVVFSGLEGGVFVADAARSRAARAAGASGELTDGPMPEGLPAGPGRILRAAGRMPGSVWLSFEKLKDDGKVENNPLYRLGKDGFTLLADDWKPAIAPWSRNRILAASTSSLRLKVKVIEPSVPRPPDDLPSPRLTDESCDRSLSLRDLAALRTGEVFVAGNCKPDTAAGAGASAMRYVVIRWTRGAPAAATDAGPGDAGDVDASAAGAGTGDKPGVVDVIPGVSTNLAHQVLHARSATDVYAAALEATGKAPPASRLFHFDGLTWGAEALPEGAALVRGIAGTADGTVWMVTDRGIWRRAPPAAWERVPPPTRAFPEAHPTWEFVDVAVVGADDVWIAARHTSTRGARDVILRLRPPKSIIRWD
jgi:hypothetical protein